MLMLACVDVEALALSWKSSGWVVEGFAVVAARTAVLLRTYGGYYCALLPCVSSWCVQSSMYELHNLCG